MKQKKLRTAVHQALLDLKEIINSEDGPLSSSYGVGICSGVMYAPKVWTLAIESFWLKTREDAFQAWSSFSGDLRFPIPDPGGERTPEQAFWDALFGGDVSRDRMWTGEYGEARRKLLDHLIDWYSKDQAVAK